MQTTDKTLGFYANPASAKAADADLERLIYFRLIAMGLVRPDACPDPLTAELGEVQRDHIRQQRRLLHGHRSPIDRRIEAFLRKHLADVADPDTIHLPDGAVRLDRHGIARRLSLPAQGEKFSNDLIDSTRIANGVLHNPRNDRRTTVGTFHVAEGGLPIPAGKKAVPKHVFAKLFQHAMRPPDALTLLPFTAEMEEPGHAWTALLLRPLVRPAVDGVCKQKTMEVRFFVPGSMVSNLDFVESIFGNGGDPDLPRNDAGLDVEGWSGHTGCVILAPHLETLTKKELGLPNIKDATDRQKQDGMCWTSPDEKYNDGSAFKITCRTDEGIIVTLIADNYFGYCKKEVKTQISYAANLMGGAEEEHAGGTIAFPSYNLGMEFTANSRRYNQRSFADIARDYASWIDLKPEGYGIDKLHPEVVYVPEDAYARIDTLNISWKSGGHPHAIPLEPGKFYVTPSGYRFYMDKHPSAPSWRLVGTLGEGAVCHKPCTVSGGGKSEISKPLEDYMLYGPIFVSDVEEDFAICDQLINRDYSDRWSPEALAKQKYDKYPSRKLLDPQRSLGSVIKLLSQSDEYTDEFNAWLETIPNYIFAILFAIKRLHQPDWGDDWRAHFMVDTVNGFPGHELKIDGRQVVGSYLRVGFDQKGAWRTFKLRQDFMPCAKLSIEDDITASTVLPTTKVQGLNPKFDPLSVKFVENCEYRFFQRPDEAIHRGFDKATEADLARADNFISNFEPLSAADARALTRSVIEFDQYTEPMQRILRDTADRGEGYVVSSAHPRIVDGKPTKNPRYLQTRPDLTDPIKPYLGALGVQLFRGLPPATKAKMPVNAVLVGRRNNPPDKAAGIRPLAVYGPLHYQDLPELFMDFICSLTGKSPSTTGAGSEGALTKRPFNALRPTADLNTALVSYIVTGLAGYSTSAGYVGPNYRVDHDVSLLIPEIVARMSPHEIVPKYLIDNGMLEKINDYEHEGETILASRLGYRITPKFLTRFLARVFDNPHRVFDDQMLRPETQDPDSFADGVKNITEAQTRVALEYFAGGGIEEACPPLRALLHIMAYGEYEGMTAESPELRQMFTLDALLESDWYQARLTTQQQRDIALWQKHVDYVSTFVNDPSYQPECEELSLADRLEYAKSELKRVGEAGYLKTLVGTLGADPMGAV